MCDANETTSKKKRKPQKQRKTSNNSERNKLACFIGEMSKVKIRGCNLTMETFE